MTNGNWLRKEKGSLFRLPKAGFSYVNILLRGQYRNQTYSLSFADEAAFMTRLAVKNSLEVF